MVLKLLSAGGKTTFGLIATYILQNSAKKILTMLKPAATVHHRDVT